MKQDLAHKRPFLLASLVFGISYPAAQSFAVPELFAIIWKMAAVGFLVPYTLRRHRTGEFVLLAAVMGLWSLGDGLIEIDMIWGAIAFAAGHIVAIWLFLRHRRVHPVLSQKLLAVAVFVLAPDIAFFLAPDRVTGLQFAIYTLFVAGMAACAWNSNFPRYRVGLGAMAFVASDMLIFARAGALADAGWVSLAIWVLYYGGVLMIATGVVTTLVKRGHYSEI
jgi:YhhN family